MNAGGRYVLALPRRNDRASGKCLNNCGGGETVFMCCNMCSNWFSSSMTSCSSFASATTAASSSFRSVDCATALAANSLSCSAARAANSRSAACSAC